MPPAPRQAWWLALAHVTIAYHHYANQPCCTLFLCPCLLPILTPDCEFAESSDWLLATVSVPTYDDNDSDICEGPITGQIPCPGPAVNYLENTWKICTTQ